MRSYGPARVTTVSVIVMPSCETCGAYVTSTWARVFGDNSGVVHACKRCSTHTMVAEGAGADPEYESEYTPDYAVEGR